ncbi:MAG: hypothetical protein PHY79_00250 [Anaerolineae bacterium]|jgi:membrane protein implicated in regulation of membrane protease activity|nr:hypothetical protein [Anaerolineae bacterium]MDX9828837.1 hypothetical protein [Anaerolineae bacterium]
MTRNHLYIAASLLSLVALALIVLGLPDRSPLWQIGLGLVALAMLLSLATRWMARKEEQSSTN